MFSKKKMATALALTAGAFAAAAPVTSAHDEQLVGGERKEGAMTFSVPLPQPALVLPSFQLTFDGHEVDSDKLWGTLGGGKLVMTISGGSTSPKATVAQHCATGTMGGSIAVARVSPDATIQAFYEDAGGSRTALGADEQPTKVGGGKPTDVTASLCQGL